MFSSNQILTVSGSLNDSDLLNALNFALKLSGAKFDSNGRIKCIYQVTTDGRYCIGKCFGQPPKGWKEYPFDFDVSIISQIIKQYLSKQELTSDIWDGCYKKGFVMSAIPESLADKDNGVVSPFYGIVEFKGYTCFYSK